MRLFVAIEPPPPMTTAAHALSEELRARISLLAPGARVTWVPPERMHVTVRFLGDLPQDQAAGVATVLVPPLTVPAFDVSVGAAGAFPAHGAPRTLWVGLTGADDRLRDLEQEVSARLAAVGIPRERRPFRAHLTVARVREPAGLRATVVDGVVAPSHPPGRIDAITLFESRLSPRGPTYTALQRTSLQG